MGHEVAQCTRISRLAPLITATLQAAIDEDLLLSQQSHPYAGPSHKGHNEKVCKYDYPRR